MDIKIHYTTNSNSFFLELFVYFSFIKNIKSTPVHIIFENLPRKLLPLPFYTFPFNIFFSSIQKKQTSKKKTKDKKSLFNNSLH